MCICSMREKEDTKLLLRESSAANITVWVKEPRGKSLRVWEQNEHFCGLQCNSFVYYSTTKKLLSLYAEWKCNHVWLLLEIMRFPKSAGMMPQSVSESRCSPAPKILSLPHRPIRATSSSSFYFSFVSLFQSFLLFSRLSSEDLNSTVLEYMTETLGYSLSEIIHVVTTNRPSALTASYHLLLSRLNRSQRGAKASKVFPL